VRGHRVEVPVAPAKLVKVQAVRPRHVGVRVRNNGHALLGDLCDCAGVGQVVGTVFGFVADVQCNALLDAAVPLRFVDGDAVVAALDELAKVGLVFSGGSGINSATKLAGFGHNNHFVFSVALFNKAIIRSFSQKSTEILGYASA
jgi:hypothetical protein